MERVTSEYSMIFSVRRTGSSPGVRKVNMRRF